MAEVPAVPGVVRAHKTNLDDSFCARQRFTLPLLFGQLRTGSMRFTTLLAMVLAVSFPPSATSDLRLAGLLGCGAGASTLHSGVKPRLGFTSFVCAACHSAALSTYALDATVGDPSFTQEPSFGSSGPRQVP